MDLIMNLDEVGILPEAKDAQERDYSEWLPEPAQEEKTPNSASQSPSLPSSGGGRGVTQPPQATYRGGREVVQRVIYTRTELNIYPGGQAYIVKTQSWMDQKVYQVHKKAAVEKKTLEEKPVKMNPLESY